MTAADNEELDALEAKLRHEETLGYHSAQGLAVSAADAIAALRARVAELEHQLQVTTEVWESAEKVVADQKSQLQQVIEERDQLKQTNAFLGASLFDFQERFGVDVPEEAGKAAKPLLDQLQQVKADAERERDFIRALFNENEWPDGGDLDQFAFQDLAVKHGILREETRTEPCGEACHCAEYHGSDEMKDGVTCYRKVEWLLDRSNDGTA